MQISKIEIAVVVSALEDVGTGWSGDTVNLERIEVETRTHTKTGFCTKFVRSPGLKLFEDCRTYKYYKSGATPEPSLVACGFLVYFVEGFLDFVEGYTFGLEEWPKEMSPSDVK